MLKETNITKLEKGRAEFAYKCAVEAKDKKEDEYYKKSEYRSRVKKNTHDDFIEWIRTNLSFY
jgi:hypothetical protein